ncbi:MAG TPA: carbohydrate ABC transporter substrate-binding protein [Acholeplasma sp.]|jgi:ABC-type glycerol-3-phosphate transport system substrate-binding protein|nr:carbohydrate ABC transporter substrate-binding protein [Acholeplasma sp.]
MKKYLLLLVTLMTALVLVACKNGADDKIVIKYAAWNLGSVNDNNIERRMIKAYEEKNPDVRVEIIERPRIVDEEGNESDATWDAFFNAQAAIQDMPDVFQVDNVVKAVQNEWVSDVYEYAKDDVDFNKIPENIRNAALYNDKLFALPQALFYMGYFINRTVINEKSPSGSITPVYGMTYPELMDAAKKNARAPITGGDGVVGIDGMNELALWLSAQQNDTFDWYTYTEGEGYNLDSDEFKNAMIEQQKYFGATYAEHSAYVLESTNVRYQKTGDEFWNPNTRFGDGDKFEIGSQAIKWGGSYNLRNWLGATVDPNTTLPGLFGADIDFIGTPAVEVEGVKYHKIPVVIDYIGVGQGTDHPEIAYDFAKWMGFGVDGYLKRLEIAEEFPQAGAVNFAPIVQDETLVDAYFELYPTLVEFKKIVNNHQDFIIESLAKTVPGFVQSRWEGRYDENRNIAAMLDLIRDGEVNLEDVIGNINDLANQYYLEAKAEFEDKIN